MEIQRFEGVFSSPWKKHSLGRGAALALKQSILNGRQFFQDYSKTVFHSRFNPLKLSRLPHPVNYCSDLALFSQTRAVEQMLF